MRIIQVNRYMPIRQNRMAFKGEEKPAENGAEKSLSEQLADLKAKFRISGTREEFERECGDLFTKAVTRLGEETINHDDAEALIDIGNAYAYNFTPILDSPAHPQRRQALKKAYDVSTVIDRILEEIYLKTNGGIKLKNLVGKNLRPYLRT